MILRGLLPWKHKQEKLSHLKVLGKPSTQVRKAVAPLHDATWLAGDPLQYLDYKEHVHYALYASILVINNTGTIKRYHNKDGLWALAHTQNTQEATMSFRLPRTTFYVSLQCADMHKQQDTGQLKQHHRLTLSDCTGLIALEAQSREALTPQNPWKALNASLQYRCSSW